MNRFLLALAAALSLLPTSGALAAPDSGPSASTSHGVSLYKAAFAKRHLKGWSVASGPAWHVNSKGVVRFGGSDTGILSAPFTTSGLHDFAVQASIKAVGKSAHQVAGYGVMVRASGTGGVLGGMFTSTNSYYNRPLLSWNSDIVGGVDVNPRAGYNTYRVDVHGADFTLSVDGQQVVRFTIADYADASQDVGIGLWSMDQRIQVKSFSVLRLSPTTPLPAAPPVRAVNLVSSDVPSGLSPEGGVYFTDQMLASLNNLPIETYNGRGLELGYQANFGTSTPPTSGPYGVFSYVYAFNSPQAAQNDLAREWPYFQKQEAGSNFAAGDVAGLGDEAHQLSVDYTETGYGTKLKATLVGIFFRRGDYEVSLFEDFVQGSMPRGEMIAQAVTLARIVDGRIQAQKAPAGR